MRPKRHIFDVYFHHKHFGYGRLCALTPQGQATVKFKCGTKIIDFRYLRYVRSFEVLLAGGRLAKGRRKDSQLPSQLPSPPEEDGGSPSAETAIVGPTIVGPIPPVQYLKPRRRYPYFPRTKSVVQLFDSDRNRDIGYSSEALDQAREARTDLEARDNKDVIGVSNIVQRYSFGPDGKAEFEGLSDIATYIPHDEADVQSYCKGRYGRSRLNVPTNLLTREQRQLIKVSEYWHRGFPVRRIAQLMHIGESAVQRYLQCLRDYGIRRIRDFGRDEAGRFAKRQ